ncbi:hypothetical protein [Erythrobacter sp. YJ-T3-07]|uniref:hypothetical protein n=1 Tax=Erythrobacter sp. YJ-T3-07 TaxID=2793063 RepID=UPI0018D3FB54|nr:hypothetical protein [Erythrobacter sp. YJ-T3-07]
MLTFLLLMQVGAAVHDHFPGSDWITEDTKRLVQPYWDCAHSAAKMLERSGEAADLIAVAAKKECEGQELDLWARYVVDSIAADQTEGIQTSFESFEAELEESLIHQVVLIRASRAND